MSDGQAGRPKRPGIVIKVRVSAYVLETYLPALKTIYPKLDRTELGGIVLDAAAQARLLLPSEPPNS